MFDNLDRRLTESLGVLARQPGGRHDQVPPVHPLSVDAFLGQDLLQVGDVILYRRNRNLLSSMVQWATGGIFSHAAMVFYTPRHDQGFDHCFIIESDQTGVDLTPLANYMRDPNVSIAVLRPRHNHHLLEHGFGHRLRAHLMETIADHYDFGAIERICSDVVRNTLFGLQSCIRGSKHTLESLKGKPKYVPHAFICSGLIQVGYAATFVELMREGRITPEAIGEVVFRNDLQEWFTPEWSHYTPAGRSAVVNDLFSTFVDDLRTTTPAELAFSGNLEWRHLSHRGRVHDVRSLAEAETIIAHAPRR